ncbi:MAG: T9SS type A sorting domain-containing protein [Bacteroidota bacterium]
MLVKKLLIASLTLASLGVWGQKNQIQPASLSQTNTAAPSVDLNSNEKTLTCVDTLRYPQFKEQRLGTSAFYLFDLWTDDNEGLSQKYDLNGTNVSISEVEFFGRLDPGQFGTPVTVEAAIYSVDANNNPQTQLGAGTLTINDTIQSYRYISLNTPVVVSSDYAVVIEPTTPGGIMEIMISDIVPGQSWDEDLARIKSDYYSGSGGNWVSVLDFSNNSPEWTNGTADFEGVITPIVSYVVDPGFTATPDPACENEQVTFTNNAAAQDILSNRMYTYDVFQTYFGLATVDSTYLYAYGDGSPATTGPNATHTYSPAGSYTAVQYNLAGVLRNCIDTVNQTITVDPLDDATFSYSASEYCTSGTDPSPTTNSTGTFSATPSGLTFVDASTGEIDLSASSTGSYDITFQTNGTCPNSSTITVDISDPASAEFSYSQAQYCGDGTTAAATLAAGATAGTFTAGSGLTINGFNGEIDIAASAAGTYTVTNTVAATPGCPQATHSETVEIIAADDASFAYSSNTLCLGGTNETPTINATGNFTATPTGLVFADASTGEIDMGASNADTYDITFQTNGTCPSSSTQSVTLTNSPDATFTYSANEFCAEVGTEAPNFPAGSSAGTFSATPSGLVINGTNGEITLDASTPNTYNVTNTIAASGSCPQVTETVTVTINGLPSVDAGADQDVCDGDQVTLTATGADTYSWDNGITQGTAFNPAVGSETYTVIGTDANGCENDDAVTVNVFENPTVDAGTDVTVCEGEEVTLTATASMGTVSWDNGISDGTPFNATTTTTYTTTADNNGCTATDQVTVTVNELPAVTLGDDSELCLQDDVISLTGSPQGGTYSGTGVTGNEFDPDAAGVGMHEITYSYTDGNGCENTATQMITVDDCASIVENAMANISIAPNPASEFIEVRSGEGNAIEQVQLMNTAGQVIPVNTSNEAANSLNVDVQHVATGTYFLNILTQQGNTVRKVVVE